jgi:hypothetical protein
MGALLYPFRGYVGPAAVAAQVAGGALVYGVVLLACNFMGSRTHLAARTGRRETAARESGRPAADRIVPHLATVGSEVV